LSPVASSSGHKKKSPESYDNGGRIFLYTLRDRNRGGAPSRGRAEISEAPSTPYARMEHSRSTNELAITRYFRSKTQFVGANFLERQIMWETGGAPRRGVGQFRGPLYIARQQSALYLFN